MHQAAPPPRPSATPCSDAAPAASTLTAAAWNRRPASRGLRGLAHWPQWLRTLPEPARPAVLTRLFGALFMALPGLALVLFAASHDGITLASAALLLASVHGLLHAQSAWLLARPVTAPSWRHTLDDHAPGLLACSALLPLALRASVLANTLLCAATVAVLAAIITTVRPTQRRRRRPLQVAAAALLLMVLVLHALALPWPVLASVLLAALCLAGSTAVQMRGGTDDGNILRHTLLVVASLCATVAVAALASAGR